MPDKLSHHLRQQVRWMRGSFIRSWWRLRYLPLVSFGFARQALGWMQLAMTSVLFIVIFVLKPIADHYFIPTLLLVPLVIGYAQALRYFAFKRSDQSFWVQLSIFLLAPVAMLWSFFVFRPLRAYAIATCFKAGWGTRKGVEVTA